ncbi:metabolite traffic protein EboE [Ideonella sp. A 288]|uniref:metabolite traffic protein EboE n=1 Tax=Ideonella sp. A 288 TaxID=1962181 RepID=UPI000B4AE3B5|nr:metabolite traffic protein EboE [Ideonella sp. A 288]
MNLGGGVHLTYCSNIHPGESWAEVRANLGRHVVAVRDRLMPEGDFGVGLRLSARAAAELAAPAVLDEFRDFLRRSRMYVFTLNGFPYGTFHGTRVKEDVYLPDWRDAERLRYTNLLADLLAELLPADPAIEGSVSTVPGAFKPALGGPRDVAAMVELLLQHVAHLVALRARTGRLITLALEPEPHCFLETIDEVVDFFGRELHGAAAVQRTMALTGLDRGAAARALHEHLGVCLDLCHAAVEFEDAADCIERLADAGIRVLKMQISAGLRLPALDAEALAALRRFQDPVYLHQVVQRTPGGLVRFADLPEAFASLDGPAADREWRVHFHVPIFLDRLAPFASTQSFIREVLAIQRAAPVSTHLEVETYTWDVLPEPFRSGPVDEAVARELAWVRTELSA